MNVLVVLHVLVMLEGPLRRRVAGVLHISLRRIRLHVGLLMFDAQRLRRLLVLQRALRRVRLDVRLLMLDARRRLIARRRRRTLQVSLLRRLMMRDRDASLLGVSNRLES